MIQINLLPPEYRPRTGTPVARFVTIVIGVVLVASATGAWFYTHYVELSNVRELRDVTVEEARCKEQQRDYSLSLQREIDGYEKRRSVIQTINRSRTLWSRKLDQFFDIITNPAGEDGYPVWLDSIEVPPHFSNIQKGGRRNRKAEHGGLFRFDGCLAMDSSADAPALSSRLFRALTGDPDTTGEQTEFYEDFIGITNPNISVVRTGAARDEQLLPPVVGSFRYELMLKPPDTPGGVSRGRKK